MDPLKFIFELIDQMTGPSKAITKELKAVESQIKTVDAALKKTQIDKMAPGLAKTRAELGLQRDALAETSAATFRFADAAEGARETLNSIGKGALVVGGAVAGFGLEFAKSAVEVASFAEDNKISLEIFAGGTEAANRILKDMIGLASHLPINDMQAMAAATQFMVSGFKEGDLTNLVTTMAAVKGFGNGERGMENFVFQLREIKAAGVNDRHLRALSQVSGIPEEAIATSLSKVAPRYANIKTPEDMQKAISMGMVNKDDFIEAVIKGVAARTGGDLMNLPGRLSKTFSGLMTTLEGRKFALMIDLDTSPGYASFRGFLANLVTMTDPQSETGKLISGQLAASFNDLFGDIFSKYAGPDGAQKIGETIRNDVLPAFRDIMTVTREIASETMTIASGWAQIIRLVRGDGAQSKVMAAGVAAVGAIPVIGPLYRGAYNLYQSTYGQVNTSSWGALSPEAQGRIKQQALFHGIGMLETASDVVDGYSNSIRAGIPEVIGAHEDMGQAGIDATNGVLKIQSPSRVFEEIGAYTTEGFIRGVRGGTDDAQDALGAMVSPGRGGSFAAIGAGGRQIVINMPINVDARGASKDDADDIAQKIGDAVPSRLVQAFEMIATEMGNN